MIKVAVVDDQALVRAGFEVLVESADDLEVIGTAADGAAAIELAVRDRPDVMLMDIRMPVLDGIEATRRILAHPACAGVRVLILTTFDLDEYVFAGLRAGASGFLLKDTPPAELLAGIRLVATGEALLSPTVTRQLIEAFVRAPEPSSGSVSKRLAVLTEREREVLAPVARDRSNAEIAADLYVSPATVKTHVARILTSWTRAIGPN